MGSVASVADRWRGGMDCGGEGGDGWKEVAGWASMGSRVGKGWQDDGVSFQGGIEDAS